MGAGEERRKQTGRAGAGGGAGGVIAGGIIGTGGGAGGTTGGTAGSGTVYPIGIKVQNQPEGPRFNPKVKAIPVSENGKTVNLNDVIGKYPAIDSDTLKIAENVRYAKGFDPDNWLTIDEKTAEIKLNKYPDRESKYLVNGTYYAKILCMTQDMPSKTATGTIAIQVEDSNDHCPTLTSHSQIMCTNEQVVFVTAEDEDDFPNSSPFTFTIIPEGTKGKWSVEHLNDTTALLRASESLWPGPYEIAIEVADQQGLSCPDVQVLNLDVCTCDKGQMCGGRSGGRGSSLGPAGISLLLLGLLLLLLIPLLLLFCHCGSGGMGGMGGFTEMPFGTKEHLIAYHTEGQGEDKEVPLMTMPFGEVDGNGMMGYMSTKGLAAAASQNHGLASMSSMGAYNQGNGGMMSTERFSQGHLNAQNMGMGGTMASRYEEEWGVGRGGGYDGIALPEEFLAEYYSQKASCAAAVNQQKDSLLMYNFEGQGSPAGSVGSNSFVESYNDLEFLNDLGPKFKTLAEICQGSAITTEVSAPAPMVPTISRATASSSVDVVTSRVQAPQPSQTQRVEQTVITDVKHSAAPAQAVVGGHSEAYLVQQPVYYTAAPVQQPTHILVEQPVHNTILLAERPAMPTMQGVYVMNAPPANVAQGLVVQGQTVVSGSPAVGTIGRGGNVVLVERGGVQDGSNGGLMVMGNLSGSQNLMMVDGQVTGGQVIQGGQMWMQQGSLQRGGLSGSQNVLVMDRQGSLSGLTQGSLQANTLSGSHGMLFREQTGPVNVAPPSGLLGANASSATNVGVPGNSRRVVQEKRVVTSKTVTKQ